VAEEEPGESAEDDGAEVFDRDPGGGGDECKREGTEMSGAEDEQGEQAPVEAEEEADGDIARLGAGAEPVDADEVIEEPAEQAEGEGGAGGGEAGNAPKPDRDADPDEIK
jgi:hypothetical protein